MDIFFTYLRDVLYYPRRATIDISGLSDQEHREFAEALMYFGNMVIETRSLAAHLSRGDLDIMLPNSDNELAAPLKALHSTLKHLTWQANQVAQGDYKQEVRFMGEFSAAFNDMVAQLAERNDKMEAEVDLEKKKAEALARTNSLFQKEYSRLENAAYRDTMTGAFNRHYGMEMLGQWTETHTAYTLVFVDMDMLKYVNDVFGHGEGDAYIKSVSDLLHEIAIAATVCRLGGDEFMVLLKKCDAPEKDMADILEGLREKLIASSASNENGKAVYPRSMSYGIVEVDRDNSMAVSDILALADDRMYEYKKAHKKERRV